MAPGFTADGFSGIARRWPPFAVAAATIIISWVLCNFTCCEYAASAHDAYRLRLPGILIAAVAGLPAVLWLASRGHSMRSWYRVAPALH